MPSLPSRSALSASSEPHSTPCSSPFFPSNDTHTNNPMRTPTAQVTESSKDSLQIVAELLGVNAGVLGNSLIAQSKMMGKGAVAVEGGCGCGCGLFASALVVFGALIVLFGVTVVFLGNCKLRCAFGESDWREC